MPLTVHQRFFISTDVAHDGARLHATLQDETYLLLVLNHDKPNGRWYLTFDQRCLPDSLMRVARDAAVLSLRQDKDYAYPVTRLQSQEIDDRAREICDTEPIIGVERSKDGAYIDAGTRLWARVGSDPQFGILKEFQGRWRSSSRLVSLTGRPVHTVDIDPAHP